jgi:hypothetical protein
MNVVIISVVISTIQHYVEYGKAMILVIDIIQHRCSGGFELFPKGTIVNVIVIIFNHFRKG